MAYTSQAAVFRPAGFDRPLRAGFRADFRADDFGAYLRAARPNRASKGTPDEKSPSPLASSKVDTRHANKFREADDTSNEEEPPTPSPGETTAQSGFHNVVEIPADSPVILNGSPAPDSKGGANDATKASTSIAVETTALNEHLVDKAGPVEVERATAAVREATATGSADTAVDRGSAPSSPTPSNESPGASNATQHAVTKDGRSDIASVIVQPKPDVSPKQSEREVPTVPEATRDNPAADRSAPEPRTPGSEVTVLDQKSAKAREEAENEADGDRTGNRQSGRSAPNRRPGAGLQTPAQDATDSAARHARSALESDALSKSTAVQVDSGDGAAIHVGRFLLTGIAESAGGGTEYAPTSVSGGAGHPTPSSPTAGLGTSGTAAETLGQVLSAGRADQDDMTGSIRLLSASTGSGQSRATLQLDPPELGRLTVQIRMEQQAMMLHVQADRADVGRLIESHLGNLRDALAVHGIRVERSDVVVRSDASADAGHQRHDAHLPSGGEHRGDSSSTLSDHSGGDHGESGGRHDADPDGSFLGRWDEDGAVSEPRRTNEEIDVKITPTAELSVDLIA